MLLSAGVLFPCLTLEYRGFIVSVGFYLSTCIVKPRLHDRLCTPEYTARPFRRGFRASHPNDGVLQTARFCSDIAVLHFLLFRQRNITLYSCLSRSRGFRASHPNGGVFNRALEFDNHRLLSHCFGKRPSGAPANIARAILWGKVRGHFVSLSDALISRFYISFCFDKEI